MLIIRNVRATARRNVSTFVNSAGLCQDRLVRIADGRRFARPRFDFLCRGLADVPAKAYPFPRLED